jgi:hypothetical protein
MMHTPPKSCPGRNEEYQQKEFHFCQVSLPAFLISHLKQLYFHSGSFFAASV